MTPFDAAAEKQALVFLGPTSLYLLQSSRSFSMIPLRSQPRTIPDSSFSAVTLPGSSKLISRNSFLQHPKDHHDDFIQGSTRRLISVAGRRESGTMLKIIAQLYIDFLDSSAVRQSAARQHCRRTSASGSSQALLSMCSQRGRCSIGGVA